MLFFPYYDLIYLGSLLELKVMQFSEMSYDSHVDNPVWKHKDN